MPADPAVRFGPAQPNGRGRPAVAPVNYGGRRLRGVFVAGVALRSDCGRFLVLSQFHPIRTWANLVLMLPAPVLWGLALETDCWPWLLNPDQGGLLLLWALVLFLAVGVLSLVQLLARLRGRRLSSSPPFSLLLIDAKTGRMYAQRVRSQLLVPLRMGRAKRMLPLRLSRRRRAYGRPWRLHCRAAAEEHSPLLTIAVDARTFRWLGTS